MTVDQQIEQILGVFREKVRAATGMELVLPPKSMTEMKTEFTEFVPGESLTAKVPFDARFTNPIGVFQGGMIATALDNVFGALSFLVSSDRPCVTVELNVSYIRPFLPSDEAIVVKAKVTAKTKQLVFMSGEVRTAKDGKLIATSTTHSMVLQDRA